MQYGLIVLLPVLGAAAFVVLCWAVFHCYQNPYQRPGDMAFAEEGTEQAEYRRAVRTRNTERLAALRWEY